MVKLSGSLSKISNQKILVIGDFLLDTYTIGKARRISPEAPVAVIHVEHEEHRPGGAGNVVLNLISLGTSVIPVGRIGQDIPGELLVRALREEGISTEGIVVQSGYPTPVKNRVIAENQQIVRVDHEKLLPLPELLEQEIIEKLPELLKGVKMVAVSDYGKGFLSQTLLNEVIRISKSLGIPVITDPKGSDFTKYAETTLIKPNLKEAYAAVNLPLEASLDEVAKRVLKLTQAEVLMITRSEEGISLFYPSGVRDDFAVEVREVKDVTGAGDTVLAVLACALASGLTLSEAAKLSNIAAGIAIERIGCARITLSDLAHRLLEIDVENKVFDDEHLFALQEVLRGKPFALVKISGKTGLTTAVFIALTALAKRPNWNIVVHVSDFDPEFVQMLASLRIVNFIVHSKEGVDQLCACMPPNEMYAALETGFQPQKIDPNVSLV